MPDTAEGLPFARAPLCFPTISTPVPSAPSEPREEWAAFRCGSTPPPILSAQHSRLAHAWPTPGPRLAHAWSVPEWSRYDSLEGAAKWARESLELHATDTREHVYTLVQLDEARSHEDIWNAAQRQLVVTGRAPTDIVSYAPACHQPLTTPPPPPPSPAPHTLFTLSSHPSPPPSPSPTILPSILSCLLPPTLPLTPPATSPFCLPPLYPHLPHPLPLPPPGKMHGFFRMYWVATLS